MKWFHILFATVIVEGIISYASMIIVDKKIHYEVIASAVIGTAITLAYKIDLFAMINVDTSIPYLGCVLTGILISRGSNYVYDLLKKIIGVRIDSHELENKYERPPNEINLDIVSHEV